MVSVSDTSTIPIAASSNGPTSLSEVHGRVGRGRPLGNDPTVATPSPASPSTADRIVAPATATSTAGTFRVILGKTSSTTSAPRPTSSAAVWVSSRWSTNARISSTNESASVEKPKSFGSCPTTIVTASPFM